MADKVPAKVIEEAAAAGAAAERKKIMARAKEKADDLLAKSNARLRRDVKNLSEKANLVQIATTAGAGVLGGMAGFKTQKALTDTTKEWVYTAQDGVEVELVGKPTTSAMMVKDVLPPAIGLLVGIGGAFIGNGTLSAAVMGAGLGFAGGSITSSALDPTP